MMVNPWDHKMQPYTEAQWEHLLQTMAPGCHFEDDALAPSRALVDAAMDAVSALFQDGCPEDFDIPPHAETSLAAIAYGRGSAGEKIKP